MKKRKQWKCVNDSMFDKNMSGIHNLENVAIWWVGNRELINIDSVLGYYSIAEKKVLENITRGNGNSEINLTQVPKFASLFF